MRLDGAVPLVVPTLAALLVAFGAAMLWVWAGSIVQVRHGLPVALAVAALAAAGVWLLVASDADPALPAAAGWVVLGASAALLVAGWVALARWAPPRRR